MSNILKVTAPIQGYDGPNSVKLNPNNPNTNVGRTEIPVTPDRVVRPDARADAGQQNSSMLKFNYESNFSRFVELLKQTPETMEAFVKLMGGGMKLLTGEAMLDSQLAELLSKLFSSIQISEADMAAFLKAQADGSVLYKGPFFELIRQAFQNTDSVELKKRILDFAKRFTDMSEGKHLMQNIKGELAEIEKYMFKKPGDNVKEMASRLSYGEQAVPGQTARNSGILKGDILPFLNQYITATHDRGNLRNQVALLAYNVARYENGNMETLLQAFEKLLGYQDFNKYFGGLDTEHLQEILRRQAEGGQIPEKEEWARNFTQMIDRAMKGEAGMEVKQAIQQLMNSILTNESVYMPLLHMMFPMEVDGKRLYSEMWINPDDHSTGAGEDDEERVIKGLIKFNIEELGDFELFFYYKGGNVDMQLDYPQDLDVSERNVKDSMNRIMAENGLRFHSLVLGSSEEQIPLQEAFPEIYERKNTINVRI